MRWIAAFPTFVALAALPAFAGAPQMVVLDVQNMTCAVCPVTVKKALENVTGVAEAKIDFEYKTATVKFDPDKARIAELIKATANAGYPSTVHK